MCLAYIRYRLASTAATTEGDEEENREKEEREWQKAKESGRCKVEMREKGGHRETAAEETFDGPLWLALISDRQNFVCALLSHILFSPDSLHNNLISWYSLCKLFSIQCLARWHPDMPGTHSCHGPSCGNGVRLPSPGHKQPYILQSPRDSSWPILLAVLH